MSSHSTIIDARPQKSIEFPLLNINNIRKQFDYRDSYISTRILLQCWEKIPVANTTRNDRQHKQRWRHNLHVGRVCRDQRGHSTVGARRLGRGRRELGCLAFAVVKQTKTTIIIHNKLTTIKRNKTFVSKCFHIAQKKPRRACEIILCFQSSTSDKKLSKINFLAKILKVCNFAT